MLNGFRNHILNRVNSKIRVVHYCNQFSLGGTERTLEIFCHYLDKDKFEVFAVCKKENHSLAEKFRVYFGLIIRHPAAITKYKNWQNRNARLPNIIKYLGASNVLLAKNDDDLENILLKIKPKILHVHYSGRPECPLDNIKIMSAIPIVVTTNQFEIENTAPAHQYVKKILFVSNWLFQNKAKWAANDSRVEIFYNPVESPFSKEDLRSIYHIPKNAFVFGRVGRPDNGIYDSISMKAYSQIQNENTWFIALSPPPKMIEEANDLKIKNFIALPPTTDEVFLSKFYNTIDVLAHARRDGETFGCNLAEAMIHGKPCISHLTNFMNAQSEVIGEAGIVVKQDDVSHYAKAMSDMINNKELWKNYSNKALFIANHNYEAKQLTKRLENIYFKLIESKK